MRENLSSTDRIFSAVVAAAVLHVAVLFGTRVELPKPSASGVQVELSLTPVTGVPEANPAPPPAADSGLQAPAAVNEAATTAAGMDSLTGDETVSAPGASSIPAGVQVATIPRERADPQPVKRFRRADAGGTEGADSEEAAHRPAADDRPPAAPVEKYASSGGVPAHLTTAVLDRQISEWSTEYNRTQPRDSDLPVRTAYVEKVVSSRVAAAAYERAWQDKVERVGNMNYPEEARRKGLTGGLLLTVGVNADGSIQRIDVRKSSGHEELDQAAIRIVRLAAPYSVFPPELKKDYDTLLITRNWRFLTDHRLATSP